MATLFVKGVDGKIVYGGATVANLNNWTMALTADVEETTDFGSDGVEREYTGVVDSGGSLSGQYKFSDTSDNTIAQEVIAEMFASGGTLAKARLKLIETTKSMWHGSVLVGDFSRDQTPRGLGGFTASWMSDGRMVKATSTST